jgi:uncharacterized 2Fe-2S/4Fe-4S cluster protein (DUF4445 family)
MISPQGSIRNSTKKIIVAENVFLLQKDVRELQLAVAAVKTGIRMMLKKHRLRKEHLDGIYIAGAFGSYLNIENSMQIGLLPRIDVKKVHFVGNSSLSGARILLLSYPEREKCRMLAARIKHFSLATDPAFQHIFVEAMEFKEWH